MNTPIFTCAKSFIKRAFSFAVAFATVLACASLANADWTIDFSRRASKTREADLSAAARPERKPASAQAPAVVVDPTLDTTPEPKKGLIDTLFDSGEPVQDIVVLHTDKGFVPSTVRVRKGGRYRIHVVNVNEKEKNVSFILDGFSEHHATYYGKIKVFQLEPRKEGSYSFQSPETSSEGKLIVFNPQVSIRAPASQE